MKKRTQTLLATLVVASLSLTTVYSQEKGADPYVAAKKDGTPTVAATTPEDQSPHEPVNISICYEEFSVPLEMAATFQRAKLTDQALYAKLTESSDKKEVKQESLVVARSRSGQKATNEGIAEMIYAVDYQPAKISNAVVEKDVEEDGETAKKATPVVTDYATGLTAPVVPAAWETRNTGLTFELEPVMGENDREFVDIRVLPQRTTLAGETKSGQGVSEVVMPVFEKQSIDTSATLRFDSPFLLGTMNRPPISKVDLDSANRVWFAFVTASIAK